MMLRTVALLAAFAGPALGQANTIPGLDVRLGALGNVLSMGREGTFPSGTSGVAMSTTSCNVGSVDVQWEQAMDPDHPFIAFIMVREKDGRMEQISDYSHVKHAFFALTDNLCDTCSLGPFGGGSVFGVGCSDTYATSNNGDNFWLGPAEEIDPWLGTWDPNCSYFDQGDPAVPPPFDCDGNRSLTQGQAAALAGGVGNRMHIDDADADPAGGALFYYQAQYVVSGEAAGNREDNLGSRQCSPGFNGQNVTWNVSGQLVNGSVLQRWAGASVAAGGDGANDGSFYVAMSVTEPTPGTWHYEYAIHNRDNSRQGGAFRLPVPSGATISNIGFRDIDDDGGNDWTATNTGTELVFSNAGDGLRWNSIYNFWFDADVAPGSGAATIDHFLPGPGGDGVTVTSTVPGGGPPPVCGATVYGTGLGGANIANLSTSDVPQSLQNFTLDVAGFNGDGVALMAVAATAANVPAFGGTLLVDATTLAAVFTYPVTAGAGSINFTMPNPGNTGYFQAAMLDGGQPSGLAFSDGMEVVVCP